ASPDELVRFRKEAEMVARLRHPAIIGIYEIGEHGDLPYIALELMDGGSLAERIHSTPQPPAFSAALVQALARGIHAAHRQGIVHRDLKPANVLLATDGTPKITDFGLARWLADERGLTYTGAVAGTPSYMAPEQTAGRGERLGPAVDIYSL